VGDIDGCLLGLIEQGDCSGYDIRKILLQTPMRRYSDSPGSIYPALRRLERRKLIVSARDRDSRRRRTTYRLTGKGRAHLRQWLRREVTEQDVVNRLDDVMLRLSFQHLIGASPADLRGFLDQLQAAAERAGAALREYIDRFTAGYPSGARLALRGGLGQYLALARWARDEATPPLGGRGARHLRRKGHV
jgi:DNA-binding PadR family transcriptional regulator